MHGNVTLGPLMYAMIGLMVVAFAGAVAVVVDALRPRTRPVPGGWAAQLFWALPQAAYVIAIVASRLIGQITAVSTVAAVLFFLVIPLQIAYLLVVVFPKQGAGAAQDADVPEAAPFDAAEQPPTSGNDPLIERPSRSARGYSPRRTGR